MNNQVVYVRSLKLEFLTETINLECVLQSRACMSLYFQIYITSKYNYCAHNVGMITKMKMDQSSLVIKVITRDPTTVTGYQQSLVCCEVQQCMISACCSVKQASTKRILSVSFSNPDRAGVLGYLCIVRQHITNRLQYFVLRCPGLWSRVRNHWSLSYLVVSNFIRQAFIQSQDKSQTEKWPDVVILSIIIHYICIFLPH